MFINIKFQNRNKYIWGKKNHVIDPCFMCSICERKHIHVESIHFMYAWFFSSRSRTTSLIWLPTTASTTSECPSACTRIGRWWWWSVMQHLTARRIQLRSSLSSSKTLPSTCEWLSEHSVTLLERQRWTPLNPVGPVREPGPAGIDTGVPIVKSRYFYCSVCIYNKIFQGTHFFVEQ